CPGALTKVSLFSPPSSTKLPDCERCPLMAKPAPRWKPELRSGPSVAPAESAIRSYGLRVISGSSVTCRWLTTFESCAFCVSTDTPPSLAEMLIDSVVEPTLSCASARRACETAICAVISRVVKPLDAMRILYWPGGKLGKLYSPWLLVVVERVWPVAAAASV